MGEDVTEERLARARRRDPAALAELLNDFGPRVFGLLLRLTGARDIAEELTQETLLRVVRIIDQYEHQGKFEAWIFRIAANLARDRGRKHKRRRSGESPNSAVQHIEADADARMTRKRFDPAEQTQEQEQVERLKESITRLSDIDREIILLRHYSELSFKEIAELLGVPLGTALARAHRAIAHLRAELGDECAV